MSGRRLIFVTLSDVSRTPYFELALPALARAGWNVTMVAPGASNALLRRVLPYPCAHITLSIPPGRIGKEASVLRALIKARVGPYDLVYLQSAALGARAVLCMLGLDMQRRKMIYQTYDYFDPQKYPLHSRLEGALSRRADAYLNAEFHRAHICKALYGFECPILVTPPVLPAAWPIARRSAEKRALMAGGREDAFVLMLHGGFNTLRRVGELFEALVGLPDRYRLVMTSSGANEPMVDQMLDKLGIRSRVLRLGRLDYAELLEYTVNADAGVLLYANNDLGNYFQAPGRLTEYLACGIPVIATNYLPLENLIFKHNIGVATDSSSPLDIMRSIQVLDAERRGGNLDASAIRDTFVREFSFEKHEPEICAAFDSLSR
jgi:glycosyltransferase involved in cell wall biosynthesis